MHPALLVVLLTLTTALLFGVIVLARAGWGGDGEGGGARRVFVVGVAIMTAASLVFSIVALYFAQQAHDRPTAAVSTPALEAAQAEIQGLQTRMAELEARLAAQPEGNGVSGAQPTATTYQIAPALREAILRAAPGGEALRRLPGGAGISVLHCKNQRDAGQYWCEVRAASGETGWIPRSLIDPAPVIGRR